MGMFDKLLGKGKEYPPVDKATPKNENLEKLRPQLESFAGQVKDNLEIVPVDNTAYILVGKPPSAFGVVWFEGDKVNNIKSLMQEKGLSQIQVQLLSDKLRDAYQHNSGAARFSAIIANRKVVFTPSDSLGKELASIIQEAKA